MLLNLHSKAMQEAYCQRLIGDWYKLYSKRKFGFH
jgi:hypothetical protein